MKTLMDGRQVHGNSEAWRHECEARAVLDMPLDQRKQHLEGQVDGDGRVLKKGILQYRGRDEMNRLKATIMLIWTDRQARNLLPLSQEEIDAHLERIACDAQGERLRADIEARMAELISTKRQAANDDQAHKAATA